MGDGDLSTMDEQRDVMDSGQLQQQQQKQQYELEFCDDIVAPLLAKQSYYLLAFSVMTILLLSFFVRRKHRWTDSCRGRPGVLIPINLLDDVHRRWMYVSCFVILATAIFAQTKYLYEWNKGRSEDWKISFEWLRVLLKIVLILHMCINYYPLFACVAHRKNIIANLVGCIYVIPLLAVEVIAISKCEIKKPPDNFAIAGHVKAMQAVSLVSRLSSIVAHVVYLVGSVYELYCNVRKGPLAVSNTFNDDVGGHEHHMVYVRYLLNKKYAYRQKKPLPTTTLGVWKKRAVDFIEGYVYKNVPGFRYPISIISAMVISAIVIFAFVMGTAALTELAYAVLRHVIAYGKTGGIIDDVGFAWGTDFLYALRVVIHTSIFMCGFVQLSFMGHMLVSYRKHVLQLYSGNNTWRYAVHRSPALLMVGAMNYPSYQIAYFMAGWLVTALLLIWIGFTLSVMIVYEIHFPLARIVVKQVLIVVAMLDVYDLLGGIYRLMRILPRTRPSLLVTLIIFVGHYIMCRNVFLQDPAILAVTNRRLYFVVNYFTFMMNIIVGIFSALKRLFISIFLGALFVSRLDHVLVMRDFEWLDKAHMTYVSMLIVDVTQNHPVLRTFIELAKKSISDRQHQNEELSMTARSVGKNRPGKLSKRQIRNKWCKMLTLINNPSLVHDRLRKRHEEWISSSLNNGTRGVEEPGQADDAKLLLDNMV